LNAIDILIPALALALAGFLSFSPRLVKSSDWKATVTPLASIMGSGFLVSAPLLAGVVGPYALITMIGLLVLAYLVGGAIRFNIRHFEPIEHAGHGAPQQIAFASRFVLVGAYFVSISYYLQLLAQFASRAVGIDDQVLAHAMTTGLLLVIAVVGIWRGLDELERVERYAVSLNLGMIGALLFGLAVYNLRMLWAGTWAIPKHAGLIDFSDLRVVLGLLIVVQGFETSRYLGKEHSADQRIVTMRRAQLLSSLIYVTFIGLATVLFHDGLGSDVTAIIQMTAPIAVTLPFLLGIAAVGSQFSAAVADNSGAGGLIENLTSGRLSSRYAYALILVVTVALTWETNVNQIIAYASRAFALFYALQGVVAFLVAWQAKDVDRRGARLVQFAFVTLVCLLVFALGLPSE
jgi:hypothetical protein